MPSLRQHPSGSRLPTREKGCQRQPKCRGAACPLRRRPRHAGGCLRIFRRRKHHLRPCLHPLHICASTCMYNRFHGCAVASQYAHVRIRQEMSCMQVTSSEMLKWLTYTWAGTQACSMHVRATLINLDTSRNEEKLAQGALVLRVCVHGNMGTELGFDPYTFDCSSKMAQQARPSKNRREICAQGS